MSKEILTTDLRSNLKGLMQKELNKLPEYIESLEPKERIEIIIKLMPFVFPKVASVKSYEGEPMNFEL